jgi:hypothetical protein
VPLPDASAVSSDVAFSVIVQLPHDAKVTSYMWMTSGWNSRVDPVMWTLEVSQDNQTWTMADSRSTRQLVTYYRRQFASVGSPEERSWYPLRSQDDLLRWADRALPTHRSQSVGPVALEYQALLANTLGSSPWVCVHHLASDDYVRQEASFWLNNIRPEVRVYVEHSNEVWNPLFPQGRFATEKGTQLGLADGTCRTNQEHCARVRYNAWRSKQIFDIWIDVWGTARNRLTFVLSTQASWSDVTRDLLSMNQGAGADMLGITAYMSPPGGVDEWYSAKTPHEVIELFTQGIVASRQDVREQNSLAAASGLGIAVYEGGVGLVEDGTIESGKAIGAITELLMATGRSPDFQAAVEAWLDMYREELGDTSSFNYFVDTGFWSKYGQWGMREYYDAATALSPAAAAVHAHLDRRAGTRPACVVADSLGRGLPSDSFLGPPAVSELVPGAVLVKGKRYKLRWGPAERLPIGLLLDFQLWQRSSCPGQAAMSTVYLGSAASSAGIFAWQVPDNVSAGTEYFIELRPQTPSTIPSNYSSVFAIVEEKDAPPTYLLYVENDVDLLSAFHRDCKKDSEWAIAPHFKIESCVYSSEEGCRQYRTSRRHEGPPPWLHGSFLPLLDCTLHVVGLRQTMRLEGLTRGFNVGSEDSLARAVANASMLPPGAISITVVGGQAARRLASVSGTVTLELSTSSDDAGLARVALGLAGLSNNLPFLEEVATSLGETNLTLGVVGDLSAVDSSASEVAMQYLSASSTTTAEGASSSIQPVPALSSTTPLPAATLSSTPSLASISSTTLHDRAFSFLPVLSYSLHRCSYGCLIACYSYLGFTWGCMNIDTVSWSHCSGFCKIHYPAYNA